MKKLYIKEVITKIIQGSITDKEIDDFNEKLKYNIKLRNDFKKELAFFLALKNLNDIDLETKLHNIIQEVENATKEKTEKGEKEKTKQKIKKREDRELDREL